MAKREKWGDFPIPGCILKPSISGAGYLSVLIIDSNGNRKQSYIHRLVAKAFIPNPYNLPQVNHKDEDKTNNQVDNLEWCTPLYNINYGNTRQKISIAQKKRGNPVVQIDKINGCIINQFPNSSTAMEITGIDASAIIKCCLMRPKFKTAGGYVWRYATIKPKPQ